MRKARFFKLILLIFECINFVFAAGIMVFRSIGQLGYPQITFLASTALFPLMALFLWLDGDRYKVYMPLFAAGKCIGVFSILCWSVFSRQVKTIEVLIGIANVESYIFYGYLFSIVVILLIIKDNFIKDNFSSDKNQNDEKNLEVV
jgi:uncharacterized membrane protein